MSKEFEVIGLIDGTEKLNNCKSIIDSCRALNIKTPHKIISILHDLGFTEEDLAIEYNGDVRVSINYNEGDASGIHWFEVDTKNIPKNIKKIRFEITW